MYKYKVSVVMAVHNVEDYIRESIDSVINQTIGIDNIQLILVDDGSPDASPQICDEYAQKYPGNILVIHKENGGVSSARNAGLDHVEGELVNFLDSDDIITPSTFQNAYNFYIQNKEQTDIVVIPMLFFDGKSGEHTLNYKFNNGSRIIDLDTEWNVCQLQVGATFINSQCLKTLRFEENLSYAEDAHLLQRVLANKCTMGVMKGKGAYMYRQRSGTTLSALQSSRGKKGWYIPYLKYFQEGTIQFYMERFGMVPRFIQYVLMYDIQWRLKLKQLPFGVLSPEEELEFYTRLYGILAYIEDEVILAQRNIYSEYKIFALLKKYGAQNVQYRDQDIALTYGNTVAFKLSKSTCYLDFIHLHSDRVVLEGRVSLFHGFQDRAAFSACINGQPYSCQLKELEISQYALGEPILYYRGFTVELPLTDSDNHFSVCFQMHIDGRSIPLTTLRAASFFPVSNKPYKNSYAYENGLYIKLSNSSLLLKRISRKEVAKCEIAFLKELWKRNKLGERNAVIARVLAKMMLRFKREPIWLISDRASRAADNGEALFRYIREHHPETKAYFVIQKNCHDYDRMKDVGPILIKDSFKHKLYLLISDFICSSQGEADVYNPFVGYSEPYRDYLSRTKFIFLQHGITYNDLSDWLDRYKKNIYGFVTTAKPEYDSIVNGKYHYSQDQIWYTGFPRFDRLYSTSERQITIMPTWRRYLFGEPSRTTKIYPINDKFQTSEYLSFYNSLLNHPRLLEAAKQYNYKIAFFPHPNILDHIDYFQKNDQVLFLTRDVEYRDVYANSKLIITDYSSAVFDFAYLRKPIIYAQFDKDMFYSGEHTLTKGYFEFERDGFGEVEYDLESTVDRIIEYMENDCLLKDIYRTRIDQFFEFNDQNNCQRVYEKIKELSSENQ